MQCDSCDRAVVTGADTCRECGASVGDGGAVTRGTPTNRSSDRPRLVTDGGQEDPDDDDPLADHGGGSEEDPDDEYLDAGDIVDEEEPQEGQPTGGQPDDGPPAGQPTEQPPAGQSTDQPPAGQPNDQPQDGQPKDQPPAGQPNDQPPAGQPNDQPPAGQPAAGEGSEAAGGQQPDQTGEPAGAGQPGGADQPGGAPAGAGGQGAPTGEAGAPLGGEGAQGEQYEDGNTLVDELKRYPLKLGTALGVLAFLIPYGLLTLATFWAWEQPPGENYEQLAGDSGWAYVDGSESWGELDVSAELFFEIAELGSGEAVVDLFRRSAGVARPEEVDPSDYPTAEEQLDPLLDLLAYNAIPDVPLLILFVLAPYVLFISSRYLARQFTPGDQPFEYAVAGMTVTIGTLVVSLLLGIAFGVTDFAGRLLFAGILIPAVIGAIGGLSIWAFDDHSALISTLTAWTVMALSIGVAMVLVPLPDLGLPEGVSLSLSILDRIVLALGAYLNAAQFNMGSHAMGRLFFLLVVLLTIGAGFVRAWQVRDAVADRMDGARVGASIFVGFLGTIALFLWAFPMATVLVDLSLGSGGFFETWFLGIEPEAVDGASTAVQVPTIETVTSVESYFRAIFVAGLIFPMTFGAIGGYLAVWYHDR